MPTHDLVPFAGGKEDSDLKLDPERPKKSMRGVGSLILQKFEIEDPTQSNTIEQESTEENPSDPENTGLEDMPPLEPVTEEEGGSSDESGPPLKIHVCYENGLPTAHSIIEDDEVAGTLENSGLLQRLPLTVPASILKCGGLDLVLEYASVRLSPYFQFVLRLIEKSYMSLVSEPVPAFAINVVHHTFNVQSNSLTEADTEVVNFYTELELRGMLNLVVAIGPIVLSAQELSQPRVITDDLADVFTARISMLRIIVPGVGTLLDVLQGYHTIGSAVIEGLSDFTGFNSGLQIYLDSVCQGELLFSSLDVTILPLNLSPRVRQPQSVIVPAEVVAPKPPVSTQAEIPPISVSYARKRSKARSAGNQPRNQVTREQLIQQGDPGRIQITRDTTTFAGVVQHDNEILTSVAQVLEAVRLLRAEMAELRTEMNEKFERIEMATTAYIGRSSQHDLAMRQNLNQTLLNTQTSPAAIELIASTPQTFPAIPDAALEFKRRVLNWQNEDLEVLCSELKSYMSGLGHVTFANNISVSLLESRVGRRGIREKLTFV